MRRPSAMAEGILRRSPVMSATSAVSIAAGEPAAAIATPTVARASAGASFTPSPTIAADPWEATRSRIRSSLSSGRRPCSTMPMPAAAPLSGQPPHYPP